MKLRLGLFALGTLAVTVPFAVLVACSDPNHPPPLGDPDTAPTQTVPKDTGVEVSIGDAGLCDKLPLGSYITQTDLSTMPPAPQGGTIVNGFYYLTQAHTYGAGASKVFRQSLFVKDGEMHFTTQEQGATVVNDPYSYVVAGTTDGGTEGGAPTTIILTTACTDASGASGSLGYTAQGNDLTLIGTKLTTIVDVFTRQ